MAEKKPQKPKAGKAPPRKSIEDGFTPMDKNFLGMQSKIAKDGFTHPFRKPPERF